MMSAGRRDAAVTPTAVVSCAPVKIRLRDLADYLITRERHEQIIAHYERQAAFLDTQARAIVVQSLRAALDTDLRRHFTERRTSA